MDSGQALATLCNRLRVINRVNPLFAHLLCLRRNLGSLSRYVISSYIFLGNFLAYDNSSHLNAQRCDINQVTRRCVYQSKCHSPLPEKGSAKAERPSFGALKKRAKRREQSTRNAHFHVLCWHIALFLGPSPFRKLKSDIQPFSFDLKRLNMSQLQIMASAAINHRAIVS